MEYAIGSIVTIATIFLFGKIFSKRIPPTEKITIGYSQAYSHELIKSALPFIEEKKPSKETQSIAFNKELFVRIIIIDDFAYWIKDNVFYKAPIEDDSINKDLAVRVDTMAMDKVELDKMIFIVDKLTEGGSKK